ncbi:TonB-dependent receptor [Sphingomonas sp. JC676]|uniref:TonB-dependent receptor plug domain-containing protein n=1 Tax=Sphingomonas sp. JC676 TaxID=2768065 RepID=UPI0016579AD3|nr:TonB-dependent receptor [Sphingomonas sp. JC676]MBC9033156.1 TonB-dependent receptor [Sphingomonas sp. JC676]
MIQRLPGFTLDLGDSATRGLSGSSGNVLIDGARPSSKSDNLFEILKRIAAKSVARIELIRGGAPGIDMQGQTIVANVVLRPSATTEIALATETYLYDDGYVGPALRLQYSRREGDKQTELAAYATTDRSGGTAWGDRTRRDASGALVQSADLALWDRYRNASLRGVVQRSAGGGKLRVNGLIETTQLRTRQDIAILSGAGLDAHSEDDDRYLNGELGLNWTRALGPRTSLEITALQRAYRERYDSLSSESDGFVSTFTGRSTAGESIARAVVKFRPNDRWAFESGGEGVYNFRDSHTAYAEEAMAVALPNDSVRVDELRGEVFGQATWRPDVRLTLEGTLRVEVSRIGQSGDTDQSKSFVYPKPRFQLTWAPARGHQFRLRFEKTVGQLDFSDFIASTEINLGTVEGGNADLVPERTTIFEAAYEHRFWGKGVFQLTASHSAIADVIDLIPLAGGFDAVGNIGNGRLEKLETRLTLPFDRIGLKNAILSGRATFRRSRVTDPLTGEKRRLSAEQPFSCSVSFDQDLKGGRFSWGAQHSCRTKYTSYRVREVRTIDNDPSLSIYGQWKPRKDLTIRVDLGNVTDYGALNLRNVYTGPRNAAALLYRERRALTHSRYLFLQVRKAL